MKVENKVSFGQTFIQSSIKYLSKSNIEKLEHSYGLGQLYPMDIFLGGTTGGDLTVAMKRCNLWDYLTINNEIPMTPANILKYFVIKRMEMVGEYMYGPKFPIEKYVIKNLDYKFQEDIAYEINDKIKDYVQKHGKKFLS